MIDMLRISKKLSVSGGKPFCIRLYAILTLNAMDCLY
jgi:hypothetical protein